MIDSKKVRLNPLNDKNIMRSGESLSFSVPDGALSPDGCHRLFFTCEDTMFPFLKDEPFGEKLYMLIDDALNTAHASEERYCLDMSCDKAEPYLKSAFMKVSWAPPRFGIYGVFENSPAWTFGLRARAQDLKIEPDGYLRFRLDKWLLRDDTDPMYTGNAPDETVILDIDPGTYDYRDYSTPVTIDDEATACILVSLEGTGYSGRVYFECPRLLSSNGYNMLSPFDTCVPKLENYGWLGLNLSKKEWPRLKISLSGRELCHREFFAAIHRFSNIELDIPQGLIRGRGDVLTIEYTSTYHDAVPLCLGECLILEEEAADFKVIYCPEGINKGKNLSVLVETARDNMTFEAEDCDFELLSERLIPKKGLNVISLKPVCLKDKMCLSIKSPSGVHSFDVSLWSERDDGVICGSGDAVYVDMSDAARVEWFLKWYIQNRLGNLITIRPVYRWGGQRYINPEAYELFVRICRDMGIYYVNLSDGRDLPGLAQNPPETMIEGSFFLGKQLHERDGQLFYWGVSPRENDAVNESFFDMALRLCRDNPQTIEGAYRAENVIVRDGVYSFKRNIDCPADMHSAHELALGTVRALSGDNFSRHTGPAVTFKYFYGGGFDFLGAETMDGALEPQLAFLRGAARAYGKNRYGVHHALQWSTAPHDCEKRYRRYMLALYLSYMHGVTDINTEEGFYFLEARYFHHNRLSEACQNHRRVEADFYKYVLSHNRRGRFAAHTAFIHGRYDGWNGFCTANVWGMPHIQAGDDCASWELMKLFYPLCKVDATGLKTTGYISPDCNKSVGYFSGTPLGQVDCVPIENGDFSSYRLLCFAGYNKAESCDMDRLLEYVRDGGVLVAAWAHFSTETNRDKIEKNQLSIIDHPLTRLLMEEKAKAELPAYRLKLGKGHVSLLNTELYPGNPKVFEAYSALVLEEQRAAMAEDRICVSCGQDVEYTRYICENGDTDLYFTAVDWYNDSSSPRKAQIETEGKKQSISVPFGKITRVTVTDGGDFITED